MHKITLTFRPRFSFSRNDKGNHVRVEDICTLRPAPRTQFRGGSCRDNQIGWRPYICKVLPGCMRTHSKTPINGNVLVLDWGQKVGKAGGGVGAGTR